MLKKCNICFETNITESNGLLNNAIPNCANIFSGTRGHIVQNSGVVTYCKFDQILQRVKTVITFTISFYVDR